MDGVPGVTERFVDTGDIRLQVAVSEPEDGSASDAPLALCLHGFPESWYSWRHQFPLLRRLGHRVWAPNLRGYGGSDRPRGHRHYSIEILMQDVAGLIDASGAREVSLLAHDWGAIIAWHFATRRIRPLERLVIMNVPHPEPFRRAFRRWEQVRRSWYVLFFQIPWLPERLLRPEALAQMMEDTSVHPERFGPAVREVYARSAALPGARRAMLDYYRALVRGGGGRRQRALGYSVIETPTLMIWGEQDLALSIAGIEGTEQWVRDLTLRRLPDASHWVQQDDPETVNRILEAWLTGQEVPHAVLD